MVFSKKARIFIPLLLIIALLLPTSALGAKAPGISGTASLLMSVDHEKIIYSKNADGRIHPASTTKVLTTLVIIDAIEKGKFSADDTFAACDGLYYNVPYDGSTANILAGEIMSVRDYLYCALLVSANEACNALAVYHSGSVEAFASELNSFAESLGCTGTHFVNANGITDDDHYTTAHDLAIIFNEASKRPLFREITTTVSYTVSKTNMSEERVLLNTDRLIRKDSSQYYEYAVMGKTGTTSAAGCCLVSMAVKDGETLIAVVMGTGSYRADTPPADGGIINLSFSETKKLYEWGFSEFAERTVVNPSVTVLNAPVSFSKDGKSAELVPAEAFTVYCSEDELSEYETYISLTDEDKPLSAPISKGKQIATLTVTHSGETVSEIPLIAKERVKLDLIAFIKADITAHPVLYIIGAFIILLIIFMIGNIRRRKARSKRRSVIKR